MPGIFGSAGLVLVALCLSALPAGAAEEVSSRPGVVQRFLLNASPQPKASVILLPGGSGKIGLTSKDVTEPHGNNVLTRIRKDTAARGFTTARTGAASKPALLIEGGPDSDADPCGGFGHHGFIGQERDATEVLVQWMTDVLASAG